MEEDIIQYMELLARESKRLRAEVERLKEFREAVRLRNALSASDHKGWPSYATFSHEVERANEIMRRCP